MPTGERNLRKGRGQKMFLFPTAREQPTLICEYANTNAGFYKVGK